jgi:nucleotide-binding universal stress UspA family protein
MRTVKRILVPTDFSPGSHAAARLALDMARVLGAEVTLLHVYQFPGYTFPDGSTFVAAPDVTAEIVRSVGQSLEAAAAKSAEGGAGTPSVRSAEGSTVDEILREAQKGEYDLIVIGTHGHSGLRHLLIGSVAERVLRHADRPVLTVRGPSK